MNKIIGDFVNTDLLGEDRPKQTGTIDRAPVGAPGSVDRGGSAPPKSRPGKHGDHPRRNRFDQLANLIGKPAALKLVEQYGGRRINVPSVMPPRHSITQTIGPAKAKLLARAYGGTWLVVPIGGATFQKKKQENALLLLADGMIAKDVARKTGLSERTVQRLKAKMKKGDG